MIYFYNMTDFKILRKDSFIALLCEDFMLLQIHVLVPRVSLEIIIGFLEHSDEQNEHKRGEVSYQEAYLVMMGGMACLPTLRKGTS